MRLRTDDKSCRADDKMRQIPSNVAVCRSMPLSRECPMIRDLWHTAAHGSSTIWHSEGGSIRVWRGTDEAL